MKYLKSFTAMSSWSCKAAIGSVRFMYEIALLTSIVLFVACGDDSSSPPKVILPSEVENADELKSYECNMSVIGEKVFVESEKKNYECDGDHWFESFDTGKSSSSSKKTSSSSSAALSSSIDFNAGSEYDEIANTLKDLRDGQIYRTVKIGKQVWMAENLNYESEKSFCYMDSSEYCSKYGRLYTWAAAIDSMRLATDKEHPQDCGYDKICSILEKVQGICPEGWSLPSTYEWSVLFSVVGGEKTAGKMLKSTSGWNDYREGDSGNGSDDYMFSVLSAGYRYFDTFKYEGDVAYYWCSTEENYESHGDFAYSVVFGSSKDGAFRVNRKNLAFSVRCVKD